MSGRSGGRDRAVELGPDDGDQPAGRVFALVLDELLVELRANEAGVWAGDAEALHDYRVALRRARSLLRAGERVYPSEERDLLGALLSELAGATSPVRDLDVLLDALDGYGELLSPELETGVQEVRAELVARRDAARSELLGLLSSDRYPVLLRRWQVLGSVHRLGGGEPGPDALRPARDVTGLLVQQSYDRLVRGSRRRLSSEDPDDWHKVRKRAKRLRYLLTAFEPVHPPDAFGPLLPRLRKVQDRLGALQDHVVHAELVEQVGLATGGPGALAAGAIVDHLHHRIPRDVERARKKMSKLRSSDVRRPVRRLAPSEG